MATIVAQQPYNPGWGGQLAGMVVGPILSRAMDQLMNGGDRRKEAALMGVLGQQVGQPLN